MTQQELKDLYIKQKQWFIDRIGKRVYRAFGSCHCESCTHVAKNGLIISDSLHARYLNDISLETGIKYFDEPIKETV